MSLVRTFFLIVLVGQVLLSILNSLFLLSDLNLVLSLFGFYGWYRNNKTSLLAYILFCSVFSTAADTARLLLWAQYLQTHTLGTATSLSNYYIILLAFGMALKVVGGLFAFFLRRSLRGEPIIPERESLLPVTSAPASNNTSGLHQQLRQSRLSVPPTSAVQSSAAKSSGYTSLNADNDD